MTKLTTEHRRALKLLAGYTSGCTDHLLRVLGFSEGHINELLLAGLASAETKRMLGNPKATAVRRIGVEIRRIRITDTGRKEASTSVD